MSEEQASTGLSEFSLGTAWLHLATLWAMAVALPLLQLYDESPEFLIARGNAWPDLLVFTVALLALPPTIMVGLEWLADRVGVRRWAHLAFVALLVAVLAIQLLKEEFDPARRSITLAALLIGAAVAYLYARGRFLPSVLTVLSPAPVVIGVWFLAFSSASELLWPKGTPCLLYTSDAADE